jgi:hypothetical protein
MGNVHRKISISSENCIYLFTSRPPPLTSYRYLCVAWDGQLHTKRLRCQYFTDIAYSTGRLELATTTDQDSNRGIVLEVELLQGGLQTVAVLPLPE